MENFNKKEHWSINHLKDVFPKYSSSDIWSVSHKFNLILLISFSLFLFITGYNGLVMVLNIISFTFFVYRFFLSIVGLNKQSVDELAELDDPSLPKYCILLPMRNENVDVVKELIKNVSNIKYDKSKLDVIMLVDQDDDYLNEIKLLDKPDYFRVLSASPTFPFTKPKVCNLGLMHSDSDIITIYDAEDNPDKDQLLKVANKFQKSDWGISCVQCRLNYNNKNGSILSKFFNLEYLAWFGITIKGLSSLQSEFPLIPLGGTSQHIKTSTLIEMGGWDAFNVTEDCDLGVRLARERKKTVIIDSVTNEIAVESLKDFIPQRTRWQMGFMVTYMSHVRDVRSLYKDLGFLGFLNFMFSILGSFISPAITPLLFVIFVLSLFYNGEGETFINKLPIITLIGNYFMIVLVHLIASIKLNKGKYWYLSIFQPFYYLIQTVTVYRAFYKLITAPNKWEKTNHILK